MSQFPCPRCGAMTSGEPGAGCTSCGTPAGPAWIEWGRLHQRLAELDQRDFALRQESAALADQRRDLHRQLADLRARLARPVPPAPAVAATPAARPETSTRSVQTILLVLGGVLLAVAAIVFTAVAWATFGVTGRATILAGITTVALAVPVLLRRRELTATAETVAALALLLVLLDGYAAWTVNLFDARDLPPSGYAALVFGVTAGIAVGYQPVSRLAVPWFAALLCAQPVLPLLAETTEPDTLTHAAGFAVTAAGNLAVLAGLRRAMPRHRALHALGFGLFLLTAGLAGVLAALKLGLTHSMPDAVLAGTILVATAALGVLASAKTQRPGARTLAASIAAVAVIAAIARPVTLAVPGFGLLIATATTVAVWVLARLLPEHWRNGPVAACAVTGGLLAVPATVNAATAAAHVLVAVSPPWHTDLGRWSVSTAQLDIGWQPLLAVALLALASGFLTGPYRRSAGHHVAVAGAGLIAMAAPAGLDLPWWSPEAIGVSVAFVLAGSAALARGEGAMGRAAARAITGAVVLSHATAASLVRPEATAVTLAAAAVGGGVVALLAAAPGRQRMVGGVASGVAVAVLPGIVGATGVALHWPEAAVIPAMTAAAGLGLGIAASLRKSGYLGYAVTGLGVATATTTLAVLATDQPSGVYAAASGLIGVAAGALLPGRRTATVGTAALPFAVALASVIPGGFAPVQTYLWLLLPWQGSGESTRDLLSPPEPLFFPDPWDPITLLLLTAGFAVAGYRLLRRPGGGGVVSWALPAAVPAAVVTSLVAPIAYDWPWPALPAIGLAGAVAAGLAGGLSPARLPAGIWVMWPIAGSIGLANCLAVRGATLAGLATAVAAGLLVALWGRTTPARVTGWLVSGTAAATLADTVGLVAELGTGQRAYSVLGVAVALLAAAALLPTAGRAAEQRTAQWLSFAAAGFAVVIASSRLLTVAAILAGYGALLGLAALRPGLRRLVHGAIGCELAAWWLFLWTEQVGVVEAYTAPFAVGALLGGLLESHRRPELDSWRAYGVALTAMFLPSLAVIAAGADPPLRRLGLGGVALVVVLAGAVRRRQAPVMVGGVTLVLLALRELVDLWELLPRWLPLAVAGLILLVLGATYEQRRRDVRRLRDTLGRMT